MIHKEDQKNTMKKETDNKTTFSSKSLIALDFSGPNVHEAPDRPL